MYRVKDMFAFSMFQIELNKKQAGTQVCPSYIHKSDLYKQACVNMNGSESRESVLNYYSMHTLSYLWSCFIITFFAIHRSPLLSLI